MALLRQPAKDKSLEPFSGTRGGGGMQSPALCYSVNNANKAPARQIVAGSVKIHAAMICRTVPP